MYVVDVRVFMFHGTHMQVRGKPQVSLLTFQLIEIGWLIAHHVIH